MNRLDFFKGLAWGLCLSATMWWGAYQAVETVFLDKENLVEQENSISDHTEISYVEETF